MTTAAFTIRTNPDVLQRLDFLAKQLDRSRNYLANQALQEFLDLQSAQNDRAQTGALSAESGEFRADGKNALMSKVVSTLLAHGNPPNWPEAVLAFNGIADLPPFESGRSHLITPAVDPLA